MCNQIARKVFFNQSHTTKVAPVGPDVSMMVLTVKGKLTGQDRQSVETIDGAFIYITLKYSDGGKDLVYNEVLGLILTMNNTCKFTFTIKNCCQKKTLPDFSEQIFPLSIYST